MTDETAPRVASLVTDAIGDPPTALEELDGGMIGTVFAVSFDDRPPLVAKVGDTPLSVEADMLRALDDAGLPVPEVVHATDDLLVLEHVPGEAAGPAAARDVADHLAALHEETAPGFGFPFDTLTGPLAQPNPWTDSWTEFFRDQRLLSMKERALDAGELPERLADRVDAVAADLSDLLVEPDRPSLIHGDCWHENVLAVDGEVTAFLDPACYYAHHEVELAYVRWADSFGDGFFDRYRERRGIADGFEGRYPVYVLYPVLTHVRLFGEEYLPELRRMLDAVGY